MKLVMRFSVMLAVVFALFGCGTDRAFVMNAKLDAPLRQRLAELQTKEKVEVVDIVGKCATVIDGQMRQSLVDAGTEVTNVYKEIFTARVPSSAILDVAALEFVNQLQLSQSSEILSK
jgi:hypothetical protein